MTTTDALTRDEWMRRYAARVMERAGWAERPAIVVSRASADTEEEEARADGRAPAWVDPEGAADSEMSYWTDDEDE